MISIYCAIFKEKPFAAIKSSYIRSEFSRKKVSVAFVNLCFKSLYLCCWYIARNKHFISKSQRNKCKIWNCTTLFSRGQYLLQILAKRATQLTSFFIQSATWGRKTIIRTIKLRTLTKITLLLYFHAKVDQSRFSMFSLLAHTFSNVIREYITLFDVTMM